MEVHTRQRTTSNCGIPRKDKNRRNGVPQGKAPPVGNPIPSDQP